MKDKESSGQKDTMSKKELIQTVAEAFSVSPGEARAAVDKTLSTIAEALAAGRNVNAAPLGKISSKLANVGT